jgi:hypothetical protein
MSWCKSGRLDLHRQILVSLAGAALSTCWSKTTDRDPNRDAGIAVVASGPVQVAAAPTKTLSGQLLICRGGDNPARIGKQRLSVAAIQVRARMRRR